MGHRTHYLNMLLSPTIILHENKIPQSPDRYQLEFSRKPPQLQFTNNKQDTNTEQVFKPKEIKHNKEKT